MTTGATAGPAADVKAFLRDRGVSDGEVEAFEAQGLLPLLVLDKLIFAGPARYDEKSLVEAAGVDPAYARDLWRALGFPALPEGEIAFYDDDLEALRLAVKNRVMGPTPPDTIVHQTRVISAAMARIAEQVTDDLELTLATLRARGVPDREAAGLISGSLITDEFERLMWYLFRRQFRAAAWRRLADPAIGRTDASTVVGFVDLVRFAAVTEQVADDELGRLIARFEEVAHHAITDGGGRVVKMIGDAVMFVAEDPPQAARVALDLVDAYSDDELLPPARAGLAMGGVLARDGDYFGPVVNLAARITDVARPSRVVVSHEMRSVLVPSGEFVFRSLPPKRLKGIGHPRLWAVGRAG